MREIPGTGLIPVPPSRPVAVVGGTAAIIVPALRAADGALPRVSDAAPKQGARGQLLDIVV